MDHVLEPFAAQGLRRFVFVLGFRGEQLKEHFAAGHGNGLHIEFVFNPKYQADNGLSALASSAKVDGHFILAMADHVFESSALDRLLREGPEPDGVTLAFNRTVEARASNPVYAFLRRCAFLATRAALPYYIVAFALLDLVDLLIVIICVGTHLAWTLVLYASRLPVVTGTTPTDGTVKLTDSP